MAIVSIFLCVFHTHLGLSNLEWLFCFSSIDGMISENVAATIDFSTS